MSAASALNATILEPELAALAAVAPAAAAERREKMAADPYAFYRGSLAIQVRHLAAIDGFAGPWVWAVGDAHADNFSTLAVARTNRARADPARPDLAGITPVIYTINDGDEEHPAPWRWDLLRLLASVAVARGVDDRDRLRPWAKRLALGWGEVLRRLADGDAVAHALRVYPQDLPKPVHDLIDDALKPKRAAKHLQKYVSGAALVRDGEHADDPGCLSFARNHLAPLLESAWPGTRLRDLTTRPTGGMASLGLRRWLALAATPSGQRIVELKERRPSRLAALLTATPFTPQATTAAAPATVVLGGDPFHLVLAAPVNPLLVRTRCHARDRVEIDRVPGKYLDDLFRLWGMLLAGFHWRGLELIGEATPAVATSLADACDQRTAGTLADHAWALVEANREAHRQFTAR
ncbi:hypothetical protein LBMAG53_05540 [Planctomycetota bacterium]|nr:hypothetical protein LBMAG53_05540 [Planctomycetota bacterium]